MEPSAGGVLIAAPSLDDPHFSRSVVHLIEHSDRGTMGVIINRPLPMDLGELWPGAPEPLQQVRIAADGGPVARHGGLILHRCPDLPGAQELLPGLGGGGESAALVERFARGPDRRGPRLFLGHSSWGKGQLASELRRGSWRVRRGRLDWIFDLDGLDGLWERLSQDIDPLVNPSVN